MYSVEAWKFDFGNLVNEERCELVSQLSGGVVGGEYGFFDGVEEFYPQS